jgi:gliding motility-associated-like protein
MVVTMKIYHLQIILLIFCGQRSLAQNQNNNWYFGNKAALTFTNGSVQTLTTSQMISVEGCASVSDPTTGNLLFYTNGLQIWDSSNNIMPNGSGLLAGGATSSSQGVLIVPYPGNINLYYVFTVDETPNGGANGFRYSVVDMSLNNGLGDIISQQKNILVQTNTTERMTVTKNANGTGYWVVIHERNNNCFKAYSLTSLGLNTNPVVTNIGSVHSSTMQTNGDGTMGYMKFSQDGNRVAVAIFAANKVEVFDFDNCSGSLSNPKSVSTLDNPYGIEFSPDNSKLYFSLYDNAGFNGAVYQLNLSTVNPLPQLVGISSSLNYQCMGALQLAPDNKIYISINNESWLSSINQPNNVGVSCNFIDQAILLPNVGLFPTTGILGLPPKVLDKVPNSQTNTFQITATNFCFGDSSYFDITGSQNFTGILWDFDDPLSGVNNTSSAISTKHVFSKIGTFNVRAIINLSCGSDTISKTVTITNCDTTNGNCRIVFPNAFTPTGDGINDKYSPITNCTFEHYEFLIFNRWGELIYKTSNQDDKWDGKYKGVDCPVGVYVYLTRYKFFTHQSKEEYGNITLLR